MINDTQMDSGEKLQWECKATGRPRPTYRWLRNGLPLTSQVPDSASCLFRTSKRLNPPRRARYPSPKTRVSFPLLSQGRLEAVNGELTIHKVQPVDSGMYQCIAENKYGAVYSSAELKILGEFVRSAPCYSRVDVVTCCNPLRTSGPGRPMFFQVENRGGVRLSMSELYHSTVGVRVVSVTMTEIPNKNINEISPMVFSTLLKQNSKKKLIT